MAQKVAPRVRPGTADFGILFPEFSVSVSGTRYAIHEYTVLEGARLAGAAKAALETGGDDLLYILADNCGVDVLEISGLDDEVISKLQAAFERANHEWLGEDEEMEQKKKLIVKPLRWSAIVQALVSNGHTLTAIRGYTLRQVNLFYEAISKLSMKQRADRIVDVSMGFNGGEETTAALKSLRRIADG
jgi:hypothetical protein